MKLYIYDGSTDEHIQREYTATEKTIRDKEIAEAEAALTAKETEAEAKATAKAALLTKLGITAEEAVLLLS
jgi:hypothetical protein